MAANGEVNNFDVLKEMSRRDLRILLGLDVLGARKNRHGTVVEVGIGVDLIGDIAADRVAVVLLVWDRAQYKAVRDELAKAQDAEPFAPCISCGKAFPASSLHPATADPQSAAVCWDCGPANQPSGHAFNDTDGDGLCDYRTAFPATESRCLAGKETHSR